MVHIQGSDILTAAKDTARLQDYIRQCKETFLRQPKVSIITFDNVSTSFSILRNTAYTVNEVYHNLSTRSQTRLEAAKFINLASLFFSAKSILYKDGVALFNPKTPKMDSSLALAQNVSSLLDAVVSVGEGALAVYKTSPLFSKVVTKLGIVSGFLGLIALVVDGKALYEHFQTQKTLSAHRDPTDTKYITAFKQRVHKLTLTSALQMLSTLVSFTAFCILTFAAPTLAVAGWALLATAGIIVLLNKCIDYHADRQLYRCLKLANRL